ncbi:ATP-binding protein [Streptomyces sp. L2]|uniref:ATP-binding protein n=1 Tax=Streptomyces sp. L2 TaxID=2162665 RepID=UPI0010134A0A|nr:ATP-binding protein [Streptomyces sp. L2]
MKRQARGGGPVAIGASSARPGGTGDVDDAGEIPGDREGGAVRARAPRLRRRLGQADLRAVPDARRELRALLRDWGKPGRSEIAELLTSELVTNALVHTDRDAVLTAVVGPRGLRVEVRDFVGRTPRVRTPEPDGDTHGRGLLLVESLADSWGVRPHGVGKSVWFELGAEAA